MGKQRQKKNVPGKSYVYRNGTDLVGIFDSRKDAEEYASALSDCDSPSTYESRSKLIRAEEKEG